MILCAVDDLIFSIKISTAAKALGTPIFFERAADKVLASIREQKPSLVIFDLNSVKLRPMDVIASMKGDPELKEIRTLGFVSHVHSNIIADAREAGIDEVLARSAFSDRLGEILSSARTTT